MFPRLPHRKTSHWLRVALGLSWCAGCGARTALNSESRHETDTPASAEVSPTSPATDLPGVTGPALPTHFSSDSSEAPEEPTEQDPLVRVPELSAVVVGKPQAESSHFHPRPTDDALRFYVRWLEYDEGMPYPYRALEWTFLDGPTSGSLAVGPEDEIYGWSDDERTGTQYQVARYVPELGWTTESLPVSEGEVFFQVNALDVAPNGVAWAATNVGLFARTDSHWERAPGWNTSYSDVMGVRSYATDRTVAFLDYDAFATETSGAWTRIDRRLPALLPSVAFQTSWVQMNVGAPGLLGVSRSGVVWMPPQQQAQAYPIHAEDGGFGVAGELLIAGETALLVSTTGATWEIYPIQLGGARGGGFKLDALAVAPGGDAYVTGIQGGMFHRFPDGSMELFNTPEDAKAHDANDRILVVRDHDGVWQARPRAGASSSGVFEAVVPAGYNGNDVYSTTLAITPIVEQFEPPTCFDVDLASNTGSQVTKVSHSSPKRLRFRAPETGTYQFRLELLDTPLAKAGYDKSLLVWADCTPTNDQRGNPVLVALKAGQYVVIEALAPEPGSSFGSAPDEAWLSIY